MNMFRRRNKESWQLVALNAVIVGGLLIAGFFQNGLDKAGIAETVYSILRGVFILTPMGIIAWVLLICVNKRRIVLGEWMTLVVLLVILALAYRFSTISDVIKNRILIVVFIMQVMIIIFNFMAYFIRELFYRQRQKNTKKRQTKTSTKHKR